MKRTLFFLAFLFAAALLSSPAQSAPTSTNPIVLNNPFTAQVWTTTSTSGANTPSVSSRTDVARSSAGSIRREARTFVSSNIQPSGSGSVEIFDAPHHLFTRLDPARLVASTTAHGPSAPALIPASGKSFGAIAKASPVDLGTQSVSGYIVRGSRQTYTYTNPANQAAGPVTVTQDTWTSSILQTALLIQTSDSLGHQTTTTVKEIVANEPDDSFFGIPSGYTRINLDTPLKNPPVPPAGPTYKESAAASPANAVPMSVLYREFFLYEAHLEHFKAAHPEVPASGSAVDRMRKNMGLSEAEWQQVATSSLKVEQEITALSAQVSALTAQYRQACPTGPQSCSGPQPDFATVRALRDQQNQAIAIESAALESSLGQAATTKLHAFLNDDIAAHTFRLAPAAPNSPSTLTTGVTK